MGVGRVSIEDKTLALHAAVPGLISFTTHDSTSHPNTFRLIPEHRAAEQFLLSVLRAMGIGSSIMSHSFFFVGATPI